VGMSRKRPPVLRLRGIRPGFTGGPGYRARRRRAADVVDARWRSPRLDVEASALIETEALARILLRAESVASSRIEGLRSARADCCVPRRRASWADTSKTSAFRGARDIDAMRFALDGFGSGEEIALERCSRSTAAAAWNLA